MLNLYQNVTFSLQIKQYQHHQWYTLSRTNLCHISSGRIHSTVFLKSVSIPKNSLENSIEHHQWIVLTDNYHIMELSPMNWKYKIFSFVFLNRWKQLKVGGTTHVGLHYHHSNKMSKSHLHWWHKKMEYSKHSHNIYNFLTEFSSQAIQRNGKHKVNRS